MEGYSCQKPEGYADKSKVNAFFKDIRNKIKNLEEKKERKLRIISYILVLMVYVITSSIIGNMIVQGVIIGILISFRDACFKNSLNEQY